MGATLFRESTLSRLSAISLAIALLGASPAPAPSPSPPPEDPAVTLVARREFVAWQAGVVDRSHYSSKTEGLTQQKIDDTSHALSQYGALIRVQWMGPLAIQDGPPGVKGYVYKMICTGGSLYEYLTMGSDGKVDGVIFRDKAPTR
jgi:hypothetical protein